MSILDLFFILFFFAWCSWAWNVLPDKLSQAHESFRQSGQSDVFGLDKVTGARIPTGLVLNAAACQFSGKAVFTLFMPVVSSHATAILPNGNILDVKAITRWPSMTSYFIQVDEA